uniref:Uncharacterized protein n=1 Tax=Arundo donax TaxID=35708 RepID=A0A0A9GCE0_ARUDO
MEHAQQLNSRLLCPWLRGSHHPNRQCQTILSRTVEKGLPNCCPSAQRV